MATHKKRCKIDTAQNTFIVDNVRWTTLVWRFVEVLLVHLIQPQNHYDFFSGSNVPHAKDA